MPRLEDTFGLYTKMLIGMGIIFQMPTIVFFLAKMRLVTARFLWQHGKYAILIAYIIAAVITPTGDPMNQTIFAAPMIALYFLSIAIAWIVNPRNKQNFPPTTNKAAVIPRTPTRPIARLVADLASE